MEWILVKDSLPVKRGDYLCVLVDNRGVQFQLVLSHYGATEDGYCPGSWWSRSGSVDYTNVTHWKPLSLMPPVSLAQ